MNVNYSKLCESDLEDEPLFKAFLDKNLELTEYIISVKSKENKLLNSDSYGSLSWEMESGSTPLIAAIKLNLFDLVEALIIFGADVNELDERGLDPLGYACSYSDTEIVKLLIDAGSESEQYGQGFNAVQSACRSSNAEALKLVLEAGVCVTQEDLSPNNQPLFLACQYEDLLIISLLLEYGANVDYVFEKKSDTYLITAILESKHEVVTILLSGNANTNIKGKHGQTALHHAISMNHINTVKLLLLNGANIHVKNDAGLSPLDLARKSKNIVLLAIVTEASYLRILH